MRAMVAGDPVDLAPGGVVDLPQPYHFGLPDAVDIDLRPQRLNVPCAATST